MERNRKMTKPPFSPESAPTRLSQRVRDQRPHLYLSQQILLTAKESLRAHKIGDIVLEKETLQSWITQLDYLHIESSEQKREAENTTNEFRKALSSRIVRRQSNDLFSQGSTSQVESAFLPTQSAPVISRPKSISTFPSSLITNVNFETQKCSGDSGVTTDILAESGQCYKITETTTKTITVNRKRPGVVSKRTPRRNKRPRRALYNVTNTLCSPRRSSSPESANTILLGQDSEDSRQDVLNDNVDTNEITDYLNYALNCSKGFDDLSHKSSNQIEHIEQVDSSRHGSALYNNSDSDETVTTGHTMTNTVKPCVPNEKTIAIAQKLHVAIENIEDLRRCVSQACLDLLHNKRKHRRKVMKAARIKVGLTRRLSIFEEDFTEKEVPSNEATTVHVDSRVIRDILAERMAKELAKLKLDSK